MVPPRMNASIVTSASAAQRQARALAWLETHDRQAPLLMLAGSLEGALELARRATTTFGPCFGWHRLTVERLALSLANDALQERQRVVASRLALEALWARVVHDLKGAKRLGRFAPVAEFPGLPRALGRTVEEARLLGLAPERFDDDLAAVMRAYAEALETAGLVDRPLVLELATQQARAGHPLVGLPMVLLDVAIGPLRERELLSALASKAPEVVALCPDADERALSALQAVLGVKPSSLRATQDRGLERLQRRLFTPSDFATHQPDETVTLLSAPGEVRECVEIARLIQREAAKGRPFDEMAVLLRAPEAYRGPLEEALRRASIPAVFARGSRQPDPSGRALLALLACIDERFSAVRFAEYLSLGEVPQPDGAGAPPAPSRDTFRPAEPEDEGTSLAPPAPQVDPEPPADPLAAPVSQGTLRAPRKFEQLLVDAKVIVGKARWKPRLDNLKKSFERARGLPDLTEGQVAHWERQLSDLRALEQFALPLLDALDALPKAAPWREWLEALSQLATRALRHPDRVLQVLQELAPLGEVGPVGLGEVRRVLSQRLLELTVAPPKRRFGQLFVGPIEAARGLSFSVVFVPGLAERIFPQKLREDPVLTDRAREAIDPGLVTEHARVGAERLMLQLATGAAREQVVLSWPRIDVHEGRPRVPSFYALEAVRAAEGELPSYEALARRAEAATDARIGWPAPKDSTVAIDDAERDLSVLGELFKQGPQAQDGKARYLVEVNQMLARSLRRRYARSRKSWSQSDGLAQPSPEAIAALQAHRLANRRYSATALQHYAACPYRFLLSAVHRLSPSDVPEQLEVLDPLQRGSLVHDVHYGVLTSLRNDGLIPLSPQTLEVALARVDEVLTQVENEKRDEYHPAIERVWKDGLEAIRADVRQWMRDTVAASTRLTPWKFELAFGLPARELQDEDSRRDPVEMPGGLFLRGSIDLVEREPDGSLWASDFKTGKQRAQPGVQIGGGSSLQPVLYALALERLFEGATVRGGTLWYCTQAGGFQKVEIRLDASARAAAEKAIATVDAAIEKAFLPAAPKSGECEYCDFAAVCGPGEERRANKKTKEPLAALLALRELP